MRRRRAGWRPARRRSASGAAALRGTAWPGWPMPRAAASRATTQARMSGGFSGLWLGRHKNIHFHFTPTHASWLSQVEVWFSILSSHALAGASFTSPRQVRDQIDAFITAYNQDAHPFEWTKQVVFSKHPRSSYANLRN